MMKRYKIPETLKIVIRQLTFLLITFSLYISQKVIFKSLILQEQSPRDISFQLPISRDYQEQYNIPARPDIEKVVFAGSFNDWNIKDPSYEMIPRGDVWYYPVSAFSGSVQYKFVVFIRGHAAPIWMHDVNNPHTIEDGFGGLNSVIRSDRWKNAGNLSNIFFLALVILLFLYIIFYWIVRLTFKSRARLSYKYILIFSLLLLFSNFIIITFNIQKYQDISKLAYTEIINVLYSGMKTHHLGFHSLEPAVNRTRLDDYFARFFSELKARLFSQEYTSARSSVHRIILFDDSITPFYIADRDEYPLRLQDRDYNQYLEEIYAHGVFKQAIREMKDSKTKNTLYTTYDTLELRAENREYFKFSRYLGYNLILSPVIEGFRIKGYVGIMIFPHLFSRQIRSTIWMNIIWNLLIVIGIILFSVIRAKTSVLDESSYSRFFNAFKITKREQEIIRLLLKGNKYADIAQRLFISEKTVKAHIYNIYQKAGVENKMGLIQSIRDSN